MKPKRQKLASLAQKICTLWFQFFGAVFASKGYPFKNIFDIRMTQYQFIKFHNHNCRFGNFRENFTFANSIKRHISDVKIRDSGKIYLYQ